jgi:ABC-type lipoprotein export system ATPase subunit
VTVQRFTIERIEVEEGFLDGLSLDFTEGLNVLIGPRGTGKTSIIELIRFCLNAPRLTTGRASLEHALSVLGGGRVTLRISAGGQELLISRTATEESPRISGAVALTWPIILAQNEIETLGLDSGGRLRLIDAFVQGATRFDRNEAGVFARIRSFCAEMRGVIADLDETASQIEALAGVEDELASALDQESEVLATLEATAIERERLEALSRELAARSVRGSVYERSLNALRQWHSEIQAVEERSPRLEAWPLAADDVDRLAKVRASIVRASQELKSSLNRTVEAATSIEQLASENQVAVLSAEEESRKIRRRLESLQQGAGAVTRHVSQLRERASQLGALRQLLEAKESQLREVQERRDQALDELDKLRVGRFEGRREAIGRLNAQLRPQIEISIERLGLVRPYADAIAATLRGSGLHYSTLAPTLAQSMSPRELVHAVENGDPARIVQLAGITEDRANRIANFLGRQQTEKILTAEIEDAVAMKLFVGDDYQDTERLSTGQRCTVILPILLLHENQALIIDQPEDHLDNAFIVETLVQAILRRQQGSQLILSSHNANIPVLGDARRVVLLGSDGKRGFVKHAGALGEPSTVEAITSVMEGGREAFQRRAAFYGSRLPPPDG